jgi:hypothetical protein
MDDGQFGHLAKTQKQTQVTKMTEAHFPKICFIQIIFGTASRISMPGRPRSTMYVIEKNISLA